jgi:hypothetical protein
VPSQQLQEQLQTQHSVDTSNYIMNKHNIESKTITTTTSTTTSTTTTTAAAAANNNNNIFQNKRSFFFPLYHFEWWMIKVEWKKDVTRADHI